MGSPSAVRRARSKVITSAQAARSLAVVASTLLIAACSSGSPSAGVSATGTGNGSTETVSTPATDQRVTATVIDTPPQFLPSTTRALAVDYMPSPSGVSTVLQALVPSVTVYADATSFNVKTVLQNPQPSGAPLTFLVDGQTSARYKVLLPIRPNGSTGWVEPAQMKKFVHAFKIVVELKAHRITVYNGAEVILSEKIATGENDTPTPNGRYYLKELLKPCYDVRQPDGSTKCTPNDAGPYGPYAYGLSGFSPVLTNFNGGTGVLGIHGTDQPQLLGTDVSHGCIRMSNSGITILAKVLPLGTPVAVLA